jgi:uncharacterized protein involved in type VI secretion and phage assembly
MPEPNVANVDVGIRCDGRDIPPGAYELLAVECTNSVNRIPRASLVLADGDFATRTFPVGDGDLFAPGAVVEVLVRQGPQEQYKPLFKGVVTRHQLAADVGGALQLTVELRDAAVQLTRGRETRAWTNVTDGKVVAKLAEGAGVSIGTLPLNPLTHAQLVQYRCTGWDFLLERAEALGLLTVVHDGILDMVPIGAADAPDHKLELGLGMTAVTGFALEADVVSQYKTVDAVGWDLAGRESKASGDGSGRGGDLPIGVKPQGTLRLVAAVSTNEEVKAWATASLARSRAAYLQGVVSVVGFAGPVPGQTLSLSGFGKRFSGLVQITGVTHRIDQDGWQLDLQVGLDPDRFVDTTEVAEPAASGLLPPISGLHLGVVAAQHGDTLDRQRVLVKLPVLGPDAPGLWARLATADAGNGRGYVFRPEVDDEVVVGFFNDDPRQPVVLGAMFGQKNPSPQAPTPENDRRAIVSRAGTVLAFIDAEQPSVVLRTPAGNTVELSDKDRSICLTDQHGNSIALEQTGVTIKTSQDLTVTADGAVRISGRTVDLG